MNLAKLVLDRVEDALVLSAAGLILAVAGIIVLLIWEERKL